MNCSGHGVCNLGNCVCVEGYQGKGCQDPVAQSAQRMMSFLEVESSIHPPSSLQPAAVIRTPAKSRSHPAALLHLQTGHSAGVSAVDCSGHGQKANGKCACGPGFDGDDCNNKVLCLSNCNNNGNCTYGICYCDPGFKGTACETAVACINDCSGNGQCWHGRCSCDAGYAGADCSDSVPRGDLPGLTITEMVVVSVVAFGVGLFLGLVLKAQLDARKKAKFNQMLQQDVNRPPFVSAP